MIEIFTKAWFASLPRTRQFFEDFKGTPTYGKIVKYCVTMIHDYMENDPAISYENTPDPERITEIDHGDYQGTLIYIIGATGYQPDTYWSTSVSYGSCSGYDTLQAIKFNWEGSDEKQPPDAVKKVMDLALHIIQKMKLIHSYELDSQ